MKEKSLGSILLLIILLLGISSPTAATTEPVISSSDWEELVTESVKRYVNLKIEHGFFELKNYNIGKTLELNNDIEYNNKYYVSVINDENETLGYAIVDGNDNYEVIEFGLGKEEPIRNESEDYYYTGQLSYAVDLENSSQSIRDFDEA